MSDPIKHECGVAIVRTKKPLAHYKEAYGTPLWGLKKLYLLMEKQRNRGQDGAGICTLKQNMPFGQQYYFRSREFGSACLDRLWKNVHDDLARLTRDLHLDPTDGAAPTPHSPSRGEVSPAPRRSGPQGATAMAVSHRSARPSNGRSRYL